MPPPLSPREGWISDGRQALELTSGELMPGQPPLLKRRKEIIREAAIRLWAEMRKAGWQVCTPQWTPPPALQPR
jgi:hypothetical protein